MKTVVIYNKSSSGSAKKYATWIQDDLNCDIYHNKEVNQKLLDKYNVIIYGGSLFAIGISGVKLIKKYLRRNKNKTAIVFGVGASLENNETKNAVYNHNFKETIKNQIHFFYFRGAFDYSKLKGINKFLIFLLIKSIKHNKKKRDLQPDEQGMLDAYNKPEDWTNRESIIPLINLAKQMIDK